MRAQRYFRPEYRESVPCDVRFVRSIVSRFEVGPKMDKMADFTKLSTLSAERIGSIGPICGVAMGCIGRYRWTVGPVA